MEKAAQTRLGDCTPTNVRIFSNRTGAEFTMLESSRTVKISVLLQEMGKI
jgi:hypothetical protein